MKIYVVYHGMKIDTFRGTKEAAIALAQEQGDFVVEWNLETTERITIWRVA